jgi:hypothetical protein
MESSKPTCYLSFPDDADSSAAAERLRSSLLRRGVTVVPPSDDGGSGSWPASSSWTPLYWVRLADVVVLDMTVDSNWVAYEAGAATALNKILIPIARPSASQSSLRWLLPRILVYDPEQIAAVADYVEAEGLRSLSAES